MFPHSEASHHGLQWRSSRLISSMPYTVSVTVPVRLAAQPYGGLRTPLELPQVLPQRGPGVLCTCHAALLEQGDDLLHKRADVARPETLPDGEAIAADRLDGVRQAIGDALGRPNE